MPRSRSLQRRLTGWLAGYALLLAAAVFAHGLAINEHAERLLWDSLLQIELEQHLRHDREQSGYRWRNTDTMQLYRDGDAGPVPAPLRGLSPGIHDELWLAGRQTVVLVRDVEGVRHTLVLDITDLENREQTLTLVMLGSAVLLVLVLVLLMGWGLRRALRPLSALAGDIGRLAPDRLGQQVRPSEDASAELMVISGALNDYLARHDRFIERERVFIDTASHELRTPTAVITGAIELALQQPGLPDAARSRPDHQYCYVNGRFVAKSQAVVHIEDRGYQFSDGVYEVCEVRAGRAAGGHSSRESGHERHPHRRENARRRAASAPVGAASGRPCRVGGRGRS